MDAFVLIGGFLLVAAAGYFLSGHLGHFLEKGGLSPYWDESEEAAAKQVKKKPAQTDFQKTQNCCGVSQSDI